MARAKQPGWHRDPYRRHDLRYWDGGAWTSHVSDLGVVGDDPVFPVVDEAARSFLATPHRHHRLSGVQRAAAVSIGGFLAVVTLAAASTASSTGCGRTSSWSSSTAGGTAAGR